MAMAELPPPVKFLLYHLPPPPPGVLHAFTFTMPPLSSPNFVPHPPSSPALPSIDDPQPMDVDSIKPHTSQPPPPLPFNLDDAIRRNKKHSRLPPIRGEKHLKNCRSPIPVTQIGKETSPPCCVPRTPPVVDRTPWGHPRKAWQRPLERRLWIPKADPMVVHLQEGRDMPEASKRCSRDSNDWSKMINDLTGQFQNSTTISSQEQGLHKIGICNPSGTNFTRQDTLNILC